MHPVPTSRLAFSLAARTSESSFPERHAEPDDMAHLHDHEPSYEHHQPHHEEPGFPKLGLLPPAFWQESWLEQYHHAPPHDAAPARHHRQQHHAQTHHWVDDAACFSPTSPADVMSSPQPNNHAQQHHPVYPADEATTPSTDWDSLLHLEQFPWLPAAHPPSSKPVLKSEDDSDSAWSGNDSPSSVEERQLPTPPPQPPAAAPRRSAPRRSRLGSVPRVTKPGTGGGVYHTFRMSKRPPPAAASSPAAVIDLIETTPFGTQPITNFGVAASDAGNDPAKMLEKRLAHKLSEKGRRNRLTSAIREIQKLMPVDVAVATPPEGEKGEVVYPHFSKVDVVEMAIGYIRRLQRENEEMKRKGEGTGTGDGGGGTGGS